MQNKLYRRRAANHLWALVAGAGAACGLAGAAAGDTWYWTGLGATTGWFSASPRSNDQPFTYSGTSQLIFPSNGDTSNVFDNWFVSNTPGGTTGRFAPASYYLFSFGGSLDLVFANALHSSRVIGTDNNDGYKYMRSLQITTQGSLEVRDALVVSGWLIRWPDCSGDHVFTDPLSVPNMFLSGSGSLKMETTFDDLIKSGDGTLIVDAPTEVYSAQQPAVRGTLTTYAGKTILRGTGEQWLVAGDGTNDALRIGREFGGQSTFPTTYPYPGWLPVAITPPNPAPVVAIQKSNAVKAGQVVRLGALGTLSFDGGESVEFAGLLTSHAPGHGTIEKTGNAGNTAIATLAAGALNNFTGEISISAGTLEVLSAVNPDCTITFGSTTSPQSATLELSGSVGPHTQNLNLSGYGRVLKTGGHAITLAGAVDPSYIGDFYVSENDLVTSSNLNNVNTMANLVTATGSGVLISGGNENIEDSSFISIQNGGLWNLGVRTETVHQLTMRGNSRINIDQNGLLKLTSIFTLPSVGVATTAQFTGLGKIQPRGTTLPVEVTRGTGTYDLDLATPVIGGTIVKSGDGVMRLGGNGAGAAPLTIERGVVYLQKSGATATTGALTIGDVDNPVSSVAPRAELLANDQIADADVVHLVDHANLVIGDWSDVIGGLDFAGDGPFNVTTTTFGNLQITDRVSAHGGSSFLTGTVNLSGGTRQFQVDPGASVLLRGIYYNGTIEKTGTGALRMIDVQGSAVLRSSALPPLNCFLDNVTLGGLTGTQAVSAEGVLTIDTAAGASHTYSGSLTGTASLLKTGPGTMAFGGSAINNYTGATTVDAGVLLLGRSSTNSAVPGNLNVSGSGIVRYGAFNQQIADAADVLVDVGATVEMLGRSEQVRNIVTGGTWTVDAPSGLPGQLAVSENLFVTGGVLSGTINGAQLSVLSSGTARIRGEINSAAIGASASTLAVGGFSGVDQLTIHGNFAISSPGATLDFTLGSPTDPALVRALGSLAYPSSGGANVRVTLPTPVRVGTTYTLINFGTGTSVPNLAKYNLGQLVGGGRGVLTLTDRNLKFTLTQNICPADIDGSGALEVSDIFDFLTMWFAGNPGADFDNTGSVAVQDIFVFLRAWFAGC